MMLSCLDKSHTKRRQIRKHVLKQGSSYRQSEVVDMLFREEMETDDIRLVQSLAETFLMHSVSCRTGLVFRGNGKRKGKIY
jgi:hypothetical protein